MIWWLSSSLSLQQDIATSNLCMFLFSFIKHINIGYSAFALPREREGKTNKQGCTSYDMFTSRMSMHGPLSFYIFDYT